MGAMAWPFEDLRKLVPFLPADDGQQEAAMSPKIPPTGAGKEHAKKWEPCQHKLVRKSIVTP